MELTWEDMSDNLNRQKNVLKTLLPLAPDAATVSKIKTRMSASCVKLFRAFILTSSREKVITDALAPLEKKITNSATKDEDVLGLIEEMEKVGEAAEKKFLATLTDDVVMEDERFVQFQEEVDEICAEAAVKNHQAIIATADTQELETEDESEAPSGASGSYVPTVDPVTKLALLDPVRNIHCNHFYGKKAIKELMKGNPKARCPYAACPNKQYLRGDHLVFDSEMAIKIAAKIASKTAGEGQQSKSKPGKSSGKSQRSRKSFVEVD